MKGWFHSFNPVLNVSPQQVRKTENELGAMQAQITQCRCGSRVTLCSQLHDTSGQCPYEGDSLRKLGKKMKEIQIDKEKVALDKIRKHQDQLLTLAACEHPEDVAEHRRRFDEHSQWAIAARSYENPAGFLNVTYHNITADETALQVVKLSSHQYRPRWLPHR